MMKIPSEKTKCCKKRLVGPTNSGGRRVMLYHEAEDTGVEPATLAGN